MRFRTILSFVLILLSGDCLWKSGRASRHSRSHRNRYFRPCARCDSHIRYPLAVLVLPPDLDADTSNLYQKTVYDLTQQAGYRFQVLNSLTPAGLDPALKVVIAVSTDPGHCPAGCRRAPGPVPGDQYPGHYTRWKRERAGKQHADRYGRFPGRLHRGADHGGLSVLA